MPNAPRQYSLRTRFDPHFTFALNFGWFHQLMLIDYREWFSLALRPFQDREKTNLILKDTFWLHRVSNNIFLSLPTNHLTLLETNILSHQNLNQIVINLYPKIDIKYKSDKPYPK